MILIQLIFVHRQKFIAPASQNEQIAAPNYSIGLRIDCNPSVTSGYDRNIGGTNPGKDSVLAGGSGQYAPEASAGISLFMVYSLNLRRRRRKASAPPHPRRNQRLMIPSGLDWPPGHGCPWPLRRTFPPPTLATHP